MGKERKRIEDDKNNERLEGLLVTLDEVINLYLHTLHCTVQVGFLELGIPLNSFIITTYSTSILYRDTVGCLAF